MTAVQLNAMHGYIADDEALMRWLTAYSKKLDKEKASDPTLMTKEEYPSRPMFSVAADL